MADPDLIYADGFDHYWPVVESSAVTINAQLSMAYHMAGPSCWTVDALGGTGAAVAMGSLSSGWDVNYWPLQNNYARVIGTATANFNTATSGSSVFGFASFLDGTTEQCTLCINQAGNIQLKRGNGGGTVIATSTEVVLLGDTNTIQYDITFHNSAGICKVWLNGVAVANLTLTGIDTCSTANNYANGTGFGLNAANSAGFNTIGYLDHKWEGWYLASGGSEQPPLTNALIETQFGSADNTAQFTVGAGVLGQLEHLTTTTNAPGANQLVLRKFTAGAACTLASVACVPGATSATAKFKAVLYSDSGGSPNALTATGTEVVGCTSGAVLTLPFASGQSLSASTDYWIGFITDTSIALRQRDTTGNLGQKKANTYGSGAPNPAGSMTTGQASWLIWGNLSAVTSANYLQTGGPSASALRYNYSATVAQVDRVTFPSLVANASAIHSVSEWMAVAKSDGGARTVHILAKSGATETSGTLGTFTPSGSIAYQQTGWLKDPNTGAAWLTADLNSAKAGYDIAA